jgi:hypothetical protein
MLTFLILINFALAAFDAWLTQRRIVDYGVDVELNGVIRKLATGLGPQMAALLGVMIPVALWSYLAFYFNTPVLFAVLVGFNLKRFEIQVASLAFEKSAKDIQKAINDYHKLVGGNATLPLDSKESLPPTSSSDKDSNAATK